MSYEYIRRNRHRFRHQRRLGRQGTLRPRSNTLMLERGRPVEHLKDYPPPLRRPGASPTAASLPKAVLEDNPVVAAATPMAKRPSISLSRINSTLISRRNHSTGSAATRSAANPSSGPARPNAGANTNSMAPHRDGIATPWPIGYKTSPPGIATSKISSASAATRMVFPNLPDGEFLPPWEMNCVGQHFIREKIHGPISRPPYHHRPLRPPDKTQAHSYPTGPRPMPGQRICANAAAPSAAISTPTPPPSPGPAVPAS